MVKAIHYLYFLFKRFLDMDGSAQLHESIYIEGVNGKFHVPEAPWGKYHTVGRHKSLKGFLYHHVKLGP